MFTKVFWIDALERGLATAAQSALLALGGQELNIVDGDWLVVAGFAAGGFVLAIIKAIAATRTGDSRSASLVGSRIEE